MSALSSVAVAQPIVWDPQTVVEKALPFFKAKLERQCIYSTLWNASISASGDAYSSQAKQAANQFKAIAISSKKEIEDLDVFLRGCLATEVAKDPLSNKSTQLKRIAQVAGQGLDFFRRAIDDTYYPTLLNQSSRVSWYVSKHVAVLQTLITGTRYLAEQIDAWPSDSYTLRSQILGTTEIICAWSKGSYTIPLQILGTCAVIGAVRFWNCRFRLEPAVNSVLQAEKGFRSLIKQVEEIEKKALKQPIVESKIKALDSASDAAKAAAAAA